MAYTLNELLDQTGINDISGAKLTKKAAASAGPDLAKLAERCRRAVDATPDERVSNEERLLVEKTAAVEIIGRTLAEIRAIDAPPDQVKTASSEVPESAAFIKAALERGHSPEQIAEFLEKKGGFIGRGIRRLQQGHATRKLKKAVYKSEGAQKNVGRAGRRWEQRVRDLENAPEAERAATLSRMRVDLTPEIAHDLVSRAGGKNWKGMSSFKELKKSLPKKPAPAPGTPGAPTHAVGANIGGTQYGLTSEQLKKMKKPALYAGAGMLAHRAVTGPKDQNQRSGRGPVIITG